MRTLNDRIAHWAKEIPDRPALVVRDRRINYAELYQLSLRAAHWLKKKGVKHGDRFVVVDINSIEIVAFILGGFQLGAVVVPLNWKYGSETLNYLISDSGAELILYGPSVEEFVQSISGNAKKILLPQALTEAQQLEPMVTADLDPEDLAMLLYTSGTTGMPKGVSITHRNNNTVGESLKDEIPDNGAESNYLITAFQFHIAGLGILILGFHTGKCNVLIPFFTPEGCCTLIQQEQIHYTFMAPIMVYTIINLPNISDYDLSSLVTLHFGGAPMNKQVLLKAQDILGCEFIQGYGLTETDGLACLLRPADYRKIFDDKENRNQHLLLSAGQAMTMNTLCVKDAEGTTLAPNEKGEICIRGNNIMKGYWNNPEMTEKVLDNDGWLHTGDIGYLDEEGYIFLTDRMDDMIVTRSVNVYPAEVEKILMEYPGVKEIAIIGIPDDADGQSICALLVPEDINFNDRKFLQWAKSKIADYKVPRTVRFLEELPRNPAGKILRRTLREPFWKNRERQI